MGEELQAALENVDDAAFAIFSQDSATRSVGIGLVQGTLSLIVVRNTSAPRTAPFQPLQSFRGLPVNYEECRRDPIALHALPAGQPIPERARHRPLVCGLEIQNLDQGLREGLSDGEESNNGSLGCFVHFRDGAVGFVSNNHVIGGENRAVTGDRIVQPSTDQEREPQMVATLRHLVPLVFSRPTTVFNSNGRAPNVVDAAAAALNPDQQFQQCYLPGRKGTPPRVLGAASLGLRVHKVGRGNGETFGFVRQIGAVIGPLQYNSGRCWFRRSIIIESDEVPSFSRGGDSGAAVVDDAGNAVGLLYGGLPGSPGGLPHQTYACPMDAVLDSMDCQLA